MAEQVLNAVRYYGGKNGNATHGTGRWIAGLLPTNAEIYVEPFAGMLGVLLQRPKAAIEIVNDLNGFVAAFWRTLRDQPDEFERLLSCTEYGLDCYGEALQIIKTAEDDPSVSDLRKAWALTVCSNVAIGDLSTWELSAFRRPVPGYRLPRTFRRKTLQLTSQRMRERIQNVQVDRIDATKVINRWIEAPSALLYLDPPYKHNYRSYLTAVDDDLVESLMNCLVAENVRARVAVSGYPSCEFAQLVEHGWTELRKETYMSAAAGGEKEPRTECLWLNFELTQAQLFAA